MRIVFLLLLSAISMMTTAQQNYIKSPLLQRVVNSADDKVYDTKAWSFNSGSPVRSTPLVSGDYIYFGNASGIFYCLHKKTGQLKWKFSAGQPIHSSAIINGNKVFFSDNGQSVYALDAATGKLAWKFKMGTKKEYPWRYDYYYSSPINYNGKLYIGGDDGFLYAIESQSGKLVWKFECKGIVRSTPAVNGKSIYIGDTEATLYAINTDSGKEMWKFQINGDTMRNENFGFDRRAITSSPVVHGEKLIFGARDGYLYCINNSNGQTIWKVDHRVSWIISTVAIKDTFVVTGTSDGRFVQAVNLETGREIWKHRTAQAVWASPLIVNDKVYAAAFDGQLTCIDLKSGKRISQYKTTGMMMSSPLWSDNMLYVGSDDGHLHALGGRKDERINKERMDRYVYYESGTNIYYRNGSDLTVKNYLTGNGYKLINADSLTNILSGTSNIPSVIVFASCYFPPSILANGKDALLRKYLDRGGRIVMTGINPLVYKIDEKTKNPFDFNRHASDTILGIDYGKGDTRSFMGQYPSFATVSGKDLGLPDYWVASLYIDENKVDVVLGKNENGKASAFARNYQNGGQFIQLWMDSEKPDRLDAIIKAAEWTIKQ